MIWLEVVLWFTEDTLAETERDIMQLHTYRNMIVKHLITHFSDLKKVQNFFCFSGVK